MCADTESKERLGEVVKHNINSLVSLFKKWSRPNSYSHKTPENISVPVVQDAGHLTGVGETRVLQHSDQQVNKCLHCAHVLCVLLHV